METDFQAAVVPTPFFVLATVKSLVVDHVGVVVPGELNDHVDECDKYT